MFHIEDSQHMKEAICMLRFLVTLVNVTYGQELPNADNSSVMDSVSGNLYKDSNAQLVVARNTARKNELEEF